jgi:hypothetical protein
VLSRQAQKQAAEMQWQQRPGGQILSTEQVLEVKSFSVEFRAKDERKGSGSQYPAMKSTARTAYPLVFVSD